MTLEELLGRIEVATGPDRLLDFEVVRTLCEGATVGNYTVDDEADIVFHAHALGISNKMPCPLYTSSIDSVLEIIERRLPEYGTQVGHPLKRIRDYGRDYGWYASVFRERSAAETGWWPGHYSAGWDDDGKFLRYYPNGALALLVSLLKALIAITALDELRKPVDEVRE